MLSILKQIERERKKKNMEKKHLQPARSSEKKSLSIKKNGREKKEERRKTKGKENIPSWNKERNKYTLLLDLRLWKTREFFIPFRKETVYISISLK